MILLLLVLLSYPTAFVEEQDVSEPWRIRELGETEVEVSSVAKLDVVLLNQVVESAHARGEHWVYDPSQIALAVVPTKPFTSDRTLTVDRMIIRHGSARTVVATLIEAGFADDSVAGARYRIWLQEDDQGRWRITKAFWAQLCSRMGQEFYSSAPCP